MTGIKDKAKAWALPTGIFLVLLLCLFGMTGSLWWGEEEIFLESHSERQRVVYGNTYELPVGEDTLSHRLITEGYGGRVYKEKCDGLRCHLVLELGWSELKDYSAFGMEKVFRDRSGNLNSNCIIKSGFEVAQEVQYYSTVDNMSCSDEKNYIKNATFDGEETVTTCTNNPYLVPAGAGVEWVEPSELSSKQETFVVDLWADVKPNCYVDAIPKIQTEELPYAWWNTSFTYKQNITANMSSGNASSIPIMANGTYGVFGKTCWINASLNTSNSIVGYVYYNSDSDYTFVDIFDSAPMPFHCVGIDALNYSSSSVFGGLFAAYLMDEGGGGVLEDAKGGAGKQFALTGTTWIEDQWRGNATNYVADNAYATETGTTFPSSGGFTYLVWFNASQNDADTHWQLNLRKAGGSDDGGALYQQNGQLFSFYRDNALTAKSVNVAFTDTSSWHMHAMKYTSAGALVGFLDGETYGSVQVGNGMVANTGFDIGRRGDGNHYWDGMLDTFFIWDKPLKNETIKRMFENNRSTMGGQEEFSTANMSWGAVNVTITPSNPTTVNNLVLSWDEDNQTTSGNYTITDNRTRWYTGNEINDSFVNLTTIDSAFTTKGQVWKAGVSIFNGTEWSGYTNSSDVTISNTIPSQPDQVLPIDNFTTSNLSVIFNCTNSSDVDNDTIQYYFSNNTAVMGNSTGSITYTFDSNTTIQWHCYANDLTSNSSMTPNRTLEVNTAVIYSVDESHTDYVSGGSTTTLYFNVSVNNLTVSNVSATLTYNNTLYYPNRMKENTTHYLFNASVYVPLGNSSQHFIWNVTATKIAAANLTEPYSYDQLVQQLSFGVCAAINDTSVMVANLTTMDEVNNTIIYNATVKGTFIIWKDNPDITTVHNIDISPANGSTYLCLSPNRTLYQSDALIEYVAAGFDTRRHYYINQTLNSTSGNNLTTNLSLLQIPLGTGVEFTVQDEADNPYVGAYIQVERYDPGTDTFKIVSMMQTDSNGQDYGFFRLYDVLYRIKVIINGITAFTGEKAVFIETTQIITITAGGWASIINNLDEPQVTLTYDNATGQFTTTWNVPDGTNKRICMSVWRNNLTSSGSAYDACSTASTGTLVHSIGTRVGSVWTAQAYTDNPYRIYKTATADRLLSPMPGSILALSIGMLILMTMAFVAIWSESGSIVMIVIGMLMLIPIGFISLGASAFIAIVIVAILLLLRMKR